MVYNQNETLSYIKSVARVNFVTYVVKEEEKKELAVILFKRPDGSHKKHLF